MPSFEYQAIDSSGKMKKGSIETSDKDAVKNQLKAQGLTPISVSEQNMLNKDINLSIGNTVKSRDLAIFCRQFNGIINAGVTVVSALEMLAEQCEKATMADAIRKVQGAVEKGDSLATGMASQPKIFPEILVNMVAAGEASGSLETAFERMTTHFEKNDKLKNTVKQAMMYPIMVVLVSILVVAVMMIKVVPSFMQMFEQIDTQLPAITRAVVGLSNFMVKWWFLLLIIVAGLCFAFKAYAATEDGGYKLSEIALKLPLFGKLIRKTAAATFTRTLSTLLASGISLIDAVEITSKVMGNKVFKRILLEVKDEVEKGVSLSEPLEASGEFPSMVYHMTKIGEETGNMEPMLDKIADYYEDEVSLATAQMTTVMEPLIIIVLAVIIGTICLAVLSPMFKLYDQLSKTS